MKLLIERMNHTGPGEPVLVMDQPFFGPKTVISNPKIAVVHDHPFKGRAVVAREDLAAHTFVGIYGGNIYLTKEYSAMMDRGETNATYGLSMMPITLAWNNLNEGTQLPQDWTMDPLEDVNDNPRWKPFIGHLINEPSEGEGHPNVEWIENLDEFRMELWTYRPVPAGHELMICYGENYEPTR